MTLRNWLTMGGKALRFALVTPFRASLFFLSGFFPRDRRLWVFGSWSGKRFADNSTNFFLYCASQTTSEFRYVWLSHTPAIVRRARELGLRAYLTSSLRGRWYAARAGVYIFDVNSHDINYWMSRKAVKVNLWHGIGVKKILRDNYIPDSWAYRRWHGKFLERLRLHLLAPWRSERPDMVIATSDAAVRIFSSAFGIPRTQIPTTGYPRNDVLLQKHYAGPPLDREYYDRVDNWRRQGRRVIAYCPTYRDRSDADLPLPLDFERLDSLLCNHEAVFLLKLHPLDRRSISDLGKFSTIHVVPDFVDINPLLRLLDCLVTDYSSLYFDYIMLNRPTIFYAYDLDDYLANARSMYMEYHEVTPGPVVETFEDLLVELEVVLQGKDQYNAERRQLQQLFQIHLDANASERVHREIVTRFVEPRS